MSQSSCTEPDDSDSIILGHASDNQQELNFAGSTEDHAGLDFESVVHALRIAFEEINVLPDVERWPENVRKNSAGLIATHCSHQVTDWQDVQQFVDLVSRFTDSMANESISMIEEESHLFCITSIRTHSLFYRAYIHIPYLVQSMQDSYPVY